MGDLGANTAVAKLNHPIEIIGAPYGMDRHLTKSLSYMASGDSRDIA
jgi:hypothetical protein